MEAFRAKGRFSEFMAGVPVRIFLNTKTSQVGPAHAAADLAFGRDGAEKEGMTI